MRRKRKQGCHCAAVTSAVVFFNIPMMRHPSLAILVDLTLFAFINIHSFSFSLGNRKDETEEKREGETRRDETWTYQPVIYSRRSSSSSKNRTSDDEDRKDVYNSIADRNLQ